MKKFILTATAVMSLGSALLAFNAISALAQIGLNAGGASINAPIASHATVDVGSGADVSTRADRDLSARSDTHVTTTTGTVQTSTVHRGRIHGGESAEMRRRHHRTDDDSVGANVTSNTHVDVDGDVKTGSRRAVRSDFND